MRFRYVYGEQQQQQQQQQQRTHSFDIASLERRKQSLMLAGAIKIINSDTLYVTDKLLEVTNDAKLEDRVLFRMYTYVLSSPEVWNKRIRL